MPLPSATIGCVQGAAWNQPGAQPVENPCRIRSATEEGGWLATVCNVSMQGIGMVSKRPFKPGMLLTVELPVDGPNG